MEGERRGLVPVGTVYMSALGRRGGAPPEEAHRQAGDRASDWRKIADGKLDGHGGPPAPSADGRAPLASAAAHEALMVDDRVVQAALRVCRRRAVALDDVIADPSGEPPCLHRHPHAWSLIAPAPANDLVVADEEEWSLLSALDLRGRFRPRAGMQPGQIARRAATPFTARLDRAQPRAPPCGRKEARKAQTVQSRTAPRSRRVPPLRAQRRNEETRPRPRLPARAVLGKSRPAPPRGPRPLDRRPARPPRLRQAPPRRHSRANASPPGR